MTLSTRWTLVAITLAAVLVGFAATRYAGGDAGSGAATSRPIGTPASAARTALPGLTPATGEPTLPGFDTARPAVGTIARVSGPFDDRYSWSELRLGAGRLSGVLTVTSDVSDLLELEVVVGFYDAHGALLGLRRAVRHHTMHEDTESGVPEESQRVVVDAPHRFRRLAVAAAIGVPVLVNE